MPKVSFAAEGTFVAKDKRVGFRATKELTQRLKAAKREDRRGILEKAKAKHRATFEITR